MDQILMLFCIIAFAIFWYLIAPRVPGLSKFT